MGKPTSPQPRPSRRDRRRQETITDITAAARAQLTGGGPDGISLRAIARQLGMTASAVHYYFPGRQALLDALIIDGFTSLADVLWTTYHQTDGLSPSQRWLTVCRAHRDWAVQRPSEYLLLYGHTGGAAARRAHPRTNQAMGNAAAVLFALMRDAVAAGDIDTDRLAAATPASLRPQLAAWRQTNQVIGDLPDGALAACMIGYAQLHGAITLELVGNLPPQLTDHSALFDLHMTHTAAALLPTRRRRQAR